MIVIKKSREPYELIRYRQLEIYRGQEPYKTPYVGILMDWLEKHK